MGVESFFGGGIPDNTAEKAFEYTAKATSPLVNGEVKMIIGENALTVTALFDIVEIPFAEMNKIALSEYIVTVETENETYAFSHIGNFCEPFYNALCESYNKAVLRSLFVGGNPILTATGDYRYTENGTSVGGSAPVCVYENCVIILPPDLSARRIPLCFVTAMDKGDYTLTLTLDTGDSYTFSKLGYDTVPFAESIEKQIRILREKSLSAVKEIVPALTAAQASQIAKIMPEGAATPIKKLMEIAPSFVTALEEKLANTRTAEYYELFKELCDPTQIYIGFRKCEITNSGDIGNLTGGLAGGGIGNVLGGLAGGNPMEMPGDMASDNAPETETLPSDPYLLWLITPSPDGKFVAVEFAEENSATYVYRTDGDFAAFAKQLNRALEAISFKCEVIRLTDEELQNPEYINYRMASKRTAALQFVRSRFAGRAIHSNPSAWKKKLTELWSC
jgi:hypothetical protein